jgi:hypothetical protein
MLASLAALAWLFLFSTAEGRLWHQHEPTRFMNCIGRCLGIGWSDGYHAYGSRNSWLPPERLQHPGVCHKCCPHAGAPFAPETNSVIETAPAEVPTAPQPVEPLEPIPYNSGR